MHHNGSGSVVTCSVEDCSYNASKNCTANDIKVGEDHATCETYTTSGSMSSQSQDMSRVGGCSVSECTFNSQMSCSAPGITVTQHSDHADCGSYRMS